MSALKFLYCDAAPSVKYLMPVICGKLLKIRLNNLVRNQ